MMKAHKVKAVLAEDGVLVLKNLPFQAGDEVEAIVLQPDRIDRNQSLTERSESNLYPLQGKQPYRYDEPFEPATSLEDWEVLA
jgi:hypothetical protein